MNFLNNTAKQILTASAGFVFIFTAQAQDGEALFKQNCGACHRVDKGRSVGPGLLDITTKRSEDWLIINQLPATQARGMSRSELPACRPLRTFDVCLRLLLRLSLLLRSLRELGLV